MVNGDNAAQRAFWNSEVGHHWVTRGADLDQMHAAVTDILFAESRPAPGEAVLDVGCGTGSTTLAFGEAVGPTGTVLGVDLSEPMLARAEERRRAAGLGAGLGARLGAGLGQVAFRLADAAGDPLPGGFDLVASRFGVMFFADPVAAFRHLAAALRPGGRIVFVTWAGPELNPWFTLPLAIAAARLGAPTPQPPEAPGPLAFANRARVVGLLEAAGVADVHAEERPVALHHPGGVPVLRELALEAGPTARLIREKEATAADVAAIGAAVADALADFASADGVRLPAAINLFRAARPA